MLYRAGITYTVMSNGECQVIFILAESVESNPDIYLLAQYSRDNVGIELQHRQLSSF